MTTIDQIIAEKLATFYVNEWPIGNLILCSIAMLLSVLLCGAIGFEREKKGSNAGLRTHLLVGLGSCIIMIISIYGFPAVFSNPGNRDVARLAAQIITGVGFLGAGAIMHRSSSIKGLTTAGSIWIVMAIGIACGSFNFIIAIIGTLLIFIILTVFKRVEVMINKRNPSILLKAPETENILGIILEVSRKFDATVNIFNTELNTESDGTVVVEITFQAVFTKKPEDINLYINALRDKTSASSVQVLSRR